MYIINSLINVHVSKVISINDIDTSRDLREDCKYLKYVFHTNLKHHTSNDLATGQLIRSFGISQKLKSIVTGR